MNVRLAVDGGQTELRMALLHDDQSVQIVKVGGFSHQASPDGVRSIATAVEVAYSQLSSPPHVERICLGLTGAPADETGRRRLADLIQTALGGCEVWLGPDMVTSHAGALAGQPGVVLAAGTGVVCLGLTRDGSTHSSGGHGHLLGDDGGGFAIGQAGMRAAMQADDGTGPPTELAALAREQFGSLDSLRHRVYTSHNPVSEIASFVPHVATAARAGDHVARGIFAGAVADLVRTTAAVVRRGFSNNAAATVPVACVGNLFAVEDLLALPFAEDLREQAPAAIICQPNGNGLDGATRLAFEGLGPYAPLMHKQRRVRA